MVLSSSKIVSRRLNENLRYKLFPRYLSRSQTFEYIVVGAGSAGCVVASRLAEEGKKVALIETGSDSSINPLIRYNIKIPLCLGYNMYNKKVNYCYYTIEQKHMKNRKIYCPRGKTLGGSSAINGMVFLRGHPLDYERWSSEGAKGWDYANVLPYFKKSENCRFDIDPNFRGTSGELSITRISKQDMNGLIPLFFESCKMSDLQPTSDFNGSCQEGYGFFDRSIYNGMRNDVFSSYIMGKKAILNNLSILTDCKVLKINFDGKKATGVSIIQEGGYENYATISAEKEVIVCAGAIDSPKLLMLSGVGDENDLKSLNIDVINHLPGVGQNLQDHLEFYIQHESSSNMTLHELNNSYIKQALAGIEWFTKGTGPISTAHLDSGAFTNTNPSIPHPDIQIHFFPYGVIEHGLKMPTSAIFQLHIGTLRAHSKGTVKLKSLNPSDEPIIDPNYLADPRDVDDLVKCIDIGRSIMSKAPLKNITIKEYSPGTKYGDSLKNKRDFVLECSESAYHPSCTCKMGADEDKMAVLDSNLKVRGLENIRVVDSSSFPSIISSNLNAAVIMLANKASDMILGKSLPPLNVKYTSKTK